MRVCVCVCVCGQMGEETLLLLSHSDLKAGESTHLIYRSLVSHCCSAHTHAPRPKMRHTQTDIDLFLCVMTGKQTAFHDVLKHCLY